MNANLKRQKLDRPVSAHEFEELASQAQSRGFGTHLGWVLSLYAHIRRHIAFWGGVQRHLSVVKLISDLSLETRVMVQREQGYVSNRE